MPPLSLSPKSRKATTASMLLRELPECVLGAPKAGRDQRLESCSTAAPSPALGCQQRARLLSDDFGALPESLVLPPPAGAEGPSTPRAACRPPGRAESFTPPPRPRAAEQPPLMKALLAGCAEAVRGALEADLEAAFVPFMDHGFEPPLCCAARAGCGAEIVRMLLEGGADVDTVNGHGQTPLAVLSSVPHARLDRIDGGFLFKVSGGSYAGQGERQQESLKVAKLLLEAGADPLRPDDGGRTPLDLARGAGNRHLILLLGGTDDEVEKGRPQAATDVVVGTVNPLIDRELFSWLNSAMASHRPAQSDCGKGRESE